MNRPDVILTGIKPTGSPHLGNYVGAIRPALDLARRSHRRSCPWPGCTQPDGEGVP